VPVTGIPASALRDSYAEARGTGRRHDALDILAPRGTPVVAAGDGQVLRLFESRDGGHTVYVLAPGGRFVHYYAHLDAYQPGLAAGQSVRRGDPLGTVGATGNARPDAPHLHFAIARLDDPKRWWDGAPVNPYPLLREDAGR
jgi:murein DD-endopeptidase MepM/ murein hydrolase activator NlpD